MTANAPSEPASAVVQNRQALDEAYRALYPELKRVARARLAMQGRGQQLGTTTLLHESFVRLVAANGVDPADRRHFFAYAAATMRSIIVDSARKGLAIRHGGDVEHVDEQDAQAAMDGPGMEMVLDVNRALSKLALVDADLAEVVSMRYFGGYSEEEIGEMLCTSSRTIKRRWRKARAWLYAEMNPNAVQGNAAPFDVQ